MAGKERINTHMATLIILDILRKYSGESDYLSGTDIRKIAMSEYNVNSIDIDTVRSILLDIKEFYPDELCCKSTDRRYKNGREESYNYNYHWNSGFSDEEIQMMIDDVMFSKMRSVNQVKMILEKLKGLASPSLRKRLNYLHLIPDRQYTVNSRTQKNISLIHSVIADNCVYSKRISFNFNGYGTDKKLHKTGSHTVVPLRICEADHKYYLICYKKGMKNLGHYRIDLMTDIKTFEEKAVDTETKKLFLSHGNKSVSEYMSEHPFMHYEDDNNKVRINRLRVKKIEKYPNASMTIIYDQFGSNWRCESKDDNDKEAIISVKCVTSAARQFARQYPDRVEFIEE